MIGRRSCVDVEVTVGNVQLIPTTCTVDSGTASTHVGMVGLTRILGGVELCMLHTLVVLLGVRHSSPTV